MNTLQRKLIRADRSLQITEHLRNVGLPRSRVCYAVKQASRNNGRMPGPSFWRRTTSELLDIYDEAKKSYRSTMKRLHPDKGGSSDDASQVARSWAAINRMYRQRSLL